ncbi:MAG: response regulator [Candidatus Rokubacteria bacterium]|nr:response regulator [Candidatus Rokubacteria bacterium]
MADRDQRDIRTRLLVTFRAEAEEHLQAITASLAALDRGLPPEEAAATVEATFREVHTLKGAARSVSLTHVEEICQACESLLSRMTRGELAIDRPMLARLGEAMTAVARLVAGDGSRVAVREVIERLERSEHRPAPETPAQPPHPGSHEAPPLTLPAGEPAADAAASGLSKIDTLRIATARLDALAVHAEELLPSKLAASERVGEARKLAEELARCRAALGRSRSSPASRSADAASRDAVLAVDAELRRLEGLVRGLVDRLARDQRAVATAVDALHDELRHLRMTPVSTVLDLFPAMVQDLARESDKDVECVARGAEIPVDRKVLQAMKDPLIHLVRNAVDHGIEPPAERVEAGKTRRGRVSVTIAPAEGHRVEIVVEDDGRGIDTGRLCAEAVRARLLTPEAARTLPEHEAVALAFRSGLSTSAIITDLSGHGLGLAIVKERVERLSGTIEITTRAGAGTRVRMLLPASVATFRGLLVESGDQAFLLPIEAVERVVRVGSPDVEHVDGRPTIRWDGRPLTVVPLGALLGLAPREGDIVAGARRPCVVLGAGAERAGLLVDEVLGEREVQVKELRRPLVRVRNVAAAGLLGTGRPVLILRPADLFRSLHEAPRPAVPAAQRAASRQKVVLVVDDSITTRTMEKNLLEAAGYQVRVAVDGIDAWTVLRTEAVDLVVSDVDMPRMDGFALTERIRADRERADLPVVLVTALESREDRERGIEVGANAYLVKSTFDQSNLLEIIRRLV